jgi:hypothetical protein
MTFWADPYPALHRLRTLDPVLWDDSLQVWLVTGAEAADTVLRCRDVSSRWADLAVTGGSTAPPGEIDDLFSNWFMLMDPPEHTRLRRELAPWFSRHAIEDLRPELSATVGGVLGSLGGESTEFVGEVAAPIASGALATALQLKVRTCTESLPHLSALASFLARPNGSTERAAATESALALRELLAKDPPPPDSPLHRLRPDVPNGWIHTAILMLFAGQGTTIELLSTSILHVLEHGLLSGLAGGDPDPVELVAELARFDTSVPQVPRVATDDFEVSGQRIRRGDRILVYLAAANRDPARFKDPDRVICPRDTPSLAFGAGVHFCLGTSLAKAVTEQALESWSHRFPASRVTEDGAVWYTDTGFRGLKRLHLELSR